jgi:hypothetical protein
MFFGQPSLSMSECSGMKPMDEGGDVFNETVGSIYAGAEDSW